MRNYLFAALLFAAPSPLIAAPPCECQSGATCTCGSNCQCPGCPQHAMLTMLQPPPTPGPGPVPPNPDAKSARVVITGCFGSLVSVGGTTLWSVGNTREFTTPAFTGDSHYDVVATGPANSITGTIPVWPDATTLVVLDWSKLTMTSSRQARGYVHPELQCYPSPTYQQMPVYQPQHMVFRGFGGGCAGGSCGRR